MFHNLFEKLRKTKNKLIQHGTTPTERQLAAQIELAFVASYLAVDDISNASISAVSAASLLCEAAGRPILVHIADPGNEIIAAAADDIKQFDLRLFAGAEPPIRRDLNPYVYALAHGCGLVVCGEGDAARLVTTGMSRDVGVAMLSLLPIDVTEAWLLARGFVAE
jgi:hypothetical protein